MKWIFYETKLNFGLKPICVDNPSATCSNINYLIRQLDRQQARFNKSCKFSTVLGHGPFQGLREVYFPALGLCSRHGDAVSTLSMCRSNSSS